MPDEQLPQEDAPLFESVTQYTDLSDVTAPTHRFDHIVGNELRCSLHQMCTVIRIKPTEVLEKGADGQLILVDKALV